MWFRWFVYLLVIVLSCWTNYTGMSTLKQLLDLGKELGLEGKDLQEFVTTQQHLEREDRQKQREIEKDRDIRALEREREQQEFELEKLRLQGIHLETSQEQGNVSMSESAHANMGIRPKLPYFEEDKDNMDAYLQRFERYAEVVGWAKQCWSLHVSALLKGKALEVYSRLTPDEAKDYDVLKKALLKRYELTEEGFRRKFKNSYPDKGESFGQFATRLQDYLKRWIEFSDIEDTVEGLTDLLVRDQLLQVCNRDMSLFLRERVPNRLPVMVKLAEQYIDAHGGSKHWHHGSSYVQTTCKNVDRQSASFKDRSDTSRVNQFPVPSVKKCHICGDPKHLSYNCPKRKTLHRVSTCTTADIDNSNDSTVSPRKEYFPRRYRGRGRGRGRKQSQFEQQAEVNANVCQVADLVVISAVNDLPTCQGFVNDKKITVLRDTGCTGVIIRQSLVKTSQFTGQKQRCLLANGKQEECSTAEVYIETPVYTGTVTALCMETPIFDVIIGNIPGVTSLNESELASAVETRSQAKAKPFLPLKVPKPLLVVNPDEFKQLQIDDLTLQKFRDLIGTDKNKHLSVKGIAEIEVKKGLLYRKFTSHEYGREIVTRQLLVPQKLRSQVLKLAHESIMGGHQGIKKTTARVLREFFWAGVSADVTRYCRSCDICQRTIPKGKVPKAPLGRMPLIDAPFQRVAIDLVGPIVPITDRKHRYILTLVDYATRYPEAIALPSCETERVAEALVDMFSRIGVPREILSDQGSQFTSDLMKEIYRLLSLKQLTSSVYHPICNGLVEKWNGTLKQILKRLCAEKPKDWDRYLSAVLFAYREVPQESLGFSPFEMLYGRTVRGPMMILKELWSKTVPEDEIKTTYQYVCDLRERMEDTCKIAQEELQKNALKYKQHYDKKSRSRTLGIGSKVLILLPTDNNKLLMHWKGPFSVKEVCGQNDYRIEVNDKVKTYHINMLKEYVEREPEDKGVLAKVGLAVVETDNQESDIEHISDNMIIPLLQQTETIDDVKVSDELTADQQKQVRSILEKYEDVFTDIPGRTHLIEHDIQLTSTEPIRRNPYAIPYALKEEVTKELRKMVDLGILEISHSPYAFPLVVVRGGGNSNRICVDFRMLNRVTIFDAEPMPNPEDLMVKMAHANYFSKLDLSKGYWQVPLSEASKIRTAIRTPLGLLHFTVMPFGLVTAPSTFSKLMRKVLDRLDNVDNFLDDIMEGTEDWDTHIKTLDELCSRLRSAGLTARPSKCFIGFRKVDCLGQQIGQNSMETIPGKINTIVDAPRPKTKTQTRAFLGLAGFYRKFIPNFSEIAVPLTDLTKKGQPNKVIWTESQEKAFTTLKEKLSSSPVLKLPNLQAEFILRTDASDIALGAILLQKDSEGIKRPVAYISRKLLDREKNYSVIEKECLSIVWAVQKFRKYLYGRAFLLETDHQPLIYLNRAKIENSRLMRWALQLQPYRFSISAIKGSENIGADYLSRIE